MPDSTFDLDIEILAASLHQIWMENKCSEGWIYDPFPDWRGKKNPLLIPYEYLSEECKKICREQVRHIPDILARAGYAAVRIKQ